MKRLLPPCFYPSQLLSPAISWLASNASRTYPFNGTSAANPQAAGIAALMKQIKPSITPNEVSQVLRLTGAYGSDPEVGSMARPLGALQYLGARP
jgi:subtilisin family serine protease